MDLDVVHCVCKPNENSVPHFGHFERNTQSLALIRVEFEIWEDEIDLMSDRVVRLGLAGKRKLVDQRVKALLTRQG